MPYLLKPVRCRAAESTEQYMEMHFAFLVLRDPNVVNIATF